MYIIIQYIFTGPQGNHGEDVKENYYYLDSTPTHSYMKSMYKYPMQHYPYDELVRENMKRGSGDPEFELEDTGLFDIMKAVIRLNLLFYNFFEYGLNTMICCYLY